MTYSFFRFVWFAATPQAACPEIPAALAPGLSSRDPSYYCQCPCFPLLEPACVVFSSALFVFMSYCSRLTYEFAVADISAKSTRLIDPSMLANSGRSGHRTDIAQRSAIVSRRLRSVPAFRDLCILSDVLLKIFIHQKKVRLRATTCGAHNCCQKGHVGKKSS